MKYDINIDIVVCTFNRCDSLRKTLDAIYKQGILPPNNVHVIVVDNNSTDRTKEICEIFKDRINITYLFEKRQGLSYARNTGVNNSTGDIVIFTDDDVCPHPNWLENLILTFKEYNCDACGGFVEPEWEVQPPKWLTSRFYGMIALKTDTKGPYQIEDIDQTPFGANMAFKREVFEDVGLFNTELGRKGNVLAGGEERDLFQRILDRKGKIVYTPHSKVKHHIEAFRTRKSYFRRWRFQYGKNLASVKGVAGGRRLFGIPPYLIRQFVISCLGALIAKFYRSSTESFRKELVVWFQAGLISGLFRAGK